MNLGFHYHSTFKRIGTSYYVPGYIGVFLNELAKHCNQLSLFLEEQPDEQSGEEDYLITSANIRIISLGTKSTFYDRLLFPSKRVNIIEQYQTQLDLLLLRAPTPLAPAIFSKLHTKIPIKFLLVGNYLDGLKDLKQPFIRKAGIILLTYYYQWLQQRAIKGQHVLVNSSKLKHDLHNHVGSISEIKTTTLTGTDFFQREDTCESKPFNIVYTGRINLQKGLRELIEATHIIRREYDVELHIVGWEESASLMVTPELIQLARKLNIEQHVVFHGKKQIGPELNEIYRMADIYCIPSYHEGFPRTIWEAMANSVPVIATKVGSIPYFLQDQTNALLIEPRNAQQIAQTITHLLQNPDLRRHLIRNGYALAQEMTLEKQTATLFKLLTQHEA